LKKDYVKVHANDDVLTKKQWENILKQLEHLKCNCDCKMTVHVDEKLNIGVVKL